MGPLHGYRILDLTKEDNTAIAASILSELGAEVIKIQEYEDKRESTKKSYHQFLSMGIKSIKLNIFTEKGAELYKRLIKTADAILCNYSEEKLKGYGLDFESLKKINDKLVYMSTSSYGKIGETEDDELLAMADSGILYTTGDEKGAPIMPGYNAGSHWTGMLVVFGVCGGILHSILNKKAIKLDLSMRDALFFMTEICTFEYTVFGKEHVRNGNHDTGVSPYGLFKTADGYLALSTVSEKAWKEVAVAIEKAHLIEDERFKSAELRVKNTDELVKEIEEFTTKLSKFEGQRYFLERGISCGPVLTALEALENEQIKARNMVSEIEIEKDKVIKTIFIPMKFSDTQPERVFLNKKNLKIEELL